MKKALLALLFIGYNCYSQINFEKGYFITNSGEKTECLIKNIDWKNNPTAIEYKLSGNASSKKNTIESIKEFGVYGTSKYVRKTVDIDRSSSDINNLDNDINPIFKEEQLLLKVLVEGKATLYQYRDANLKRYFYSLDSGSIEQLIYKKIKTRNNKIAENNQFKQQLWHNLKCTTIETDKIQKTNYVQSDLLKLFVEYNKCNTAEFVVYKKKKTGLFNVTLRPRINSSGLTVENQTTSYKLNNELAFGFGIEAEYILPFNKNKWSVFFEPTYQRYKSSKIIESNNVSGNELTVTTNYSSIELPIGFRHYFFLNNDSKIFLNVAYAHAFNSSTDTTIEFTRTTDNSHYRTLEVRPRPRLAFGVGYKIKDYSIEFRAFSKGNILENYVAWDSNYKTISVVLGYTIF